ncbi:hypothetical protein [Streptacidiphilus sp. EB103A]|uniref:hypothetical protein n=1 Tax=Streptacidiphilus sp. EB103A TaxID=3156275 RepID=UPI00351388AB
MLSRTRQHRRLTRLTAVAAVIGAVAAGTAGPAFAGNVTWKNAGTGYYLVSENGTPGKPGNAYTVLDNSPGNDCSVYTVCAKWTDIKQGDGTWVEESQNTNGGGCLDSNSAWTSYGSVYVHGCFLDSNGVDNDTYQKWHELATTTGWALEDEQTGLFLDGGTGPGGNGRFSSTNLFANSNYGNGDAWQRWH